MLSFKSIHDLEEYILNQITILDFNNKNIDELPSLAKYKKLNRLIMNNNKLTSIPDLPTNLKYLSLKNNYVKEIPCNLPPKLLSLDCENNKIEKLNGLPQSLKILICNNNEIKYIDISGNINLVRLDCLNNNFDISINELPSSLLVLNKMNIVKSPRSKLFSIKDVIFELEFDSDDDEVL